MEVARSSKGISVTQLKYTLDLLKEIELSGCKPADTPMDANSKLGLNPEDEPVDQDRILRYLKHDPGKDALLSIFWNFAYDSG
ncbi:putative mitochondrial protein [Cucumis melo var. makuwa]|uniref:Mitochondrial protein n=1 Tax=Cucumis melo var. makuwa TaxID=1194695 RepID=A0A5D3C3V3_CUCMM|nr:putative mitochondrial protein [Cucumis melo var. makuwa]TYK06581.1 putative mitochondrial protein [Cucumis melo var. makuwa]